MSTLTDLLKGIANPKPGKIPGTKDYNVSESMGLGTGYQIPLNIASKVFKAQPVTQQYQTPIPTSQTPAPDYSRDTGGGASAYTTSGSGGETNTLREIAGDSYNSTLDRIKDTISYYRDIGNRSMGEAQNVLKDITGNIKGTYDNVRTQAGAKKQSAIDTLTQEGVKVGDLYETGKGTARRALESAMLKNRSLARAMGRLDSSFYDDRQAQATETGSRNIGELSRENAYKQSGIETRKTDTGTYFDDVTTKADLEEAQLTSQANLEYQSKVNDILDFEKFSGIDSEDELAQAENDYRSKLDGISQYVQNKALQIALIQAQGGDFSNSNIDSYQTVDANLGDILATNVAQENQQDVPTFTGDGGKTGYNYRPYINPTDEYLKQQSKLGNILYSMGNKS